MSTLARKYEKAFGTKVLDIESLEVITKKDRGRTWWIFKDGSAIGLDKKETICVSDNFMSNNVSQFNRRA